MDRKPNLVTTAACSRRQQCRPPRRRPLVGGCGILFLLLAAPAAYAQVQLSITASDPEAAESPPDNGQFTVSRSGGDMISPVTVTYSVSGTAEGGADYAQLNGTLTLNLFQSSSTIPVIVSGDDGLFEGEETVVVTLEENPEAGVTVGNATATVTISDSPHSVTASAVSDAVEDESAGEIVVSLGGENRSGAVLSVEYTVAGTATPDTDYEALSGVAQIAEGSSSASIAVTPISDDLLEDDKTVQVTLTSTSDSRAPVGDPAVATVTIIDDDTRGDDDGDGLSNAFECPDFDDCRDTDEDGIPDYQDPDDDGDGVPTAMENPPDQDTDGDGIPDYLDPDDDGDGVLTRDEDLNEDGDGNPATNPTDTDGDGIPDYLDPEHQGAAGLPTGDLDGDGLTNEQEEELGTDPRVADTDGDGVDDGAEVDAGTDPLDPTSFPDADGDLVPDEVEKAEGTDPNDASDFLDSDGGGTPDYVETVAYPNLGLPPGDVMDPADDARDFDGDGLPDLLEIAIGSAPDDSDSPTANGGGDDSGNGVTNAIEAYLATIGITSVDALSDFDRDGYPDAMEVAFGLNPLVASARDSDQDGVPDIVELAAGADIDAATDTDGDGVPDAREIALGTDPLDANSPVANGHLDDDGDGVTNAIEHVIRMLGGPEDSDESTDTDGDGIGDADEIRTGTDPLHDEQPVPWIELRQADFGPVRALGLGGGAATATAVTGGHQTGRLRYDWSGSDNAVLAVVSGGQTNRSLVFSPETLPPGTYDLVVRVQRTVGNFSSGNSVVRFTTDVLPNADTGDLADADNDGIPDSADDSDARRGFANRLQTGGSREMQADAGLRLQLGTTARTTQSSSAAITREDIANAGDGSGGSVGNSEDDFDYLSGIYDFEITNLPEVGAIARVVIPLSAPIGEFPTQRKYLPGSGWRDFVEDDNNAVASVAASGACPAPDDGGWQAGLTPGHNCVRLTIEDGGPNDGDAGEGPNGVIKDPGGVGTPKGRVTAGQGSGSIGPTTLAVLGVVVAWALVRRRRASISSPAAAPGLRVWTPKRRRRLSR